jgi:hypothetical protein
MANKEYRKNGQCVQPGIEYEPEGNGWPKPLADPSTPLKYSYINGKSGKVESKSVTDVQTKE